MIPTILEIFACLIAAISGFIGLIYGMNTYNDLSMYTVSISGLLLFTIYSYLINTSEGLQRASKPNSTKFLICKMLQRSIYGIFALQIIAITLMVK